MSAAMYELTNEKAEITNSVIATYSIEQFEEKRSEISDRINTRFTEKVNDSSIIVNIKKLYS